MRSNQGRAQPREVFTFKRRTSQFNIFFLPVGEEIEEGAMILPHEKKNLNNLPIGIILYFRNLVSVDLSWNALYVFHKS